jgi:alpha-D-ribose 1-methylphosphonate 5-triphosphate synthase subunit PhnH
MARPGRVQHVVATVGTPPQLMRGTAAIALTLFDHDTPIWLDPGLAQTSDVSKWLKFHSGAPVVTDPSICHFALVADASLLPDLSCFALGSNEYPDRSTTLIVQVESLTQGRGYELQGPGIDGAKTLSATIAPKDLFKRLSINEALFPRGIDVVLVAGEEIVAIPRTTRLSRQGG